MKHARYVLFALLIAAVAFAFSCSKKTMSPEDFLKIEDEVNTTDMTPESKEKVAAKFGYTVNEYLLFEERARTDRKLQEQLGALRLKKSAQ